MYAAAGRDAANVTENQANRYAYFNEQARLAAGAQETVIAGLGKTFDEVVNLKNPMQAYNEMLGVTSDTLVRVGGRTEDQERALESMRDEYERVSEQLFDYAQGARGVGMEEEARAEKIGELNERLGQLNAAMGPLAAITDEYNVVAGNATINTAALYDEMYEAAVAAGADATELAILGGALGLYSEEALDAALKTALVQEKIEMLAASYAAGEISVYQMRLQLNQFVADLEAVPTQKNISFNLEIPPIPAELQGGGVKMTPQGPAVYGASGLDFTVPPGFPNDSFGPIYVQSGEHVQVTPAGQSSMGGATINIYAYPGQSPQAIATAVNQQLAVRG
jgi:hypothetical protein